MSHDHPNHPAASSADAAPESPSAVIVGSGAWFGSSGREKHCKTIEALPAWKRFLLCWLSYRKWKLARACDHAAIHALHRLGDDELFDRLLRVSDAQWAEIFNLPNEADMPSGRE